MGTVFIGDLVQLCLLDIVINLGINWLRDHMVKIDYKDCKVSWRGEKRPYSCFIGKA